MKLRLVLGLQFLLALFAIVVFISATINIFWIRYASYLPATIPIAGTDIPFSNLVLTYTILLIVLTALMFLLVFLLFDRLFIQPIKAITEAMVTFAQSQKFTPFSKISLSTKEIRELANVFVSFTDNVAQVHERDMEISRVKSDFISTAAHQLRTPLTGIRWALEALQKEQLTEFQKTMVDNAADKSRDLVEIVGTLLDISSIESGKHKYTFQTVKLDELAEAVYDDFVHMAEERSIALTFTPSETQLPPIRADLQQIKWILNNLIENALRYTPSGGTVRISFAQVPDRVQVLVQDTGIGITSQDKNNIFERFYRADNAIAKENKGNGLGLYISRTIASDHGGELNFAPNTHGPGTIFNLSLPVAS